MRFETTLPFNHDRIVVDGEFYHERRSGRTRLFVKRWATDIYPTDWETYSCNVIDYKTPRERHDFKKWLLEGR